MTESSIFLNVLLAVILLLFQFSECYINTLSHRHRLDSEILEIPKHTDGQHFNSIFSVEIHFLIPCKNTLSGKTKVNGFCPLPDKIKHRSKCMGKDSSWI